LVVRTVQPLCYQGGYSPEDNLLCVDFQSFLSASRQTLLTATYPIEVVEAARWVQIPDNALLSGDQLFAALEKEDWDPSVKSLVRFPPFYA
jgi:hypothetical protein